MTPRITRPRPWTGRWRRHEPSPSPSSAGRQAGRVSTKGPIVNVREKVSVRLPVVILGITSGKPWPCPGETSFNIAPPIDVEYEKGIHQNRTRPRCMYVCVYVRVAFPQPQPHAPPPPWRTTKVDSRQNKCHPFVAYSSDRHCFGLDVSGQSTVRGRSFLGYPYLASKADHLFGRVMRSNNTSGSNLWRLRLARLALPIMNGSDLCGKNKTSRKNFRRWWSRQASLAALGTCISDFACQQEKCNSVQTPVFLGNRISLARSVQNMDTNMQGFHS